MATKVMQLSGEEYDKIRGYLIEKKFDFLEKENAVIYAKREGITVTLYNSGKLVVQGKDIEDFLAGLPIVEEKKVFDRIGTDEAGKGDYFGPLVVAGVYAKGSQEEELRKLGVRDSKHIKDDAILEIAKKIKRICAYDIVKITPEKYNQLYARLKNLNRLLAWAHARAIENMLHKVDCNLVVSDQFGDERFLRGRLMERGRRVRLVQRPRAEDDVAVAAASILARAEYLLGLKRLSEEYGMVLPKGSTSVSDAARALAGEHGGGVLEKVAKLHFKITRELI